MRIGMLSQWFDPETGPAALPGVYARQFAARGHEVSVLTGFPNYPGGRLYEGYRQSLRQTTREGAVEVTRVPLIASHSGSAAARIANYASFAASAAAFGRPALRDVDLVWAYNSPATITWPLLAHTRGGRVPIFLHVQDLWPDSLVHSGMLPAGWLGRRIEAVVEPVVRLAERRSAVIGVISPSVRELILERNPRLDPASVVFAPNPTDESLFLDLGPSTARRSHGAGERFELMYIGAIGEVQGLDDLVGAAEILAKRDDIRITLVGDGIARARLERRARDAGLANIRFVGRVEQAEVPGWISRSDAQLVSLGTADFLRFTTPSKISSLLASRIPVVGHLAGDGARLIADAEAGLVSSPGDAEGLAAAIAAMADAPASRRERWASSGREYYERRLSARVVSGHMLDRFERLVSQTNGERE